MGEEGKKSKCFMDSNNNDKPLVVFMRILLPFITNFFLFWQKFSSVSKYAALLMDGEQEDSKDNKK